MDIEKLGTFSAYNVGFVGFGNIAEAIWRGIDRSGLVPAENCYFSRRDPNLAADVSRRYGLNPVDINTLIQKSDIIIFCVKPQNIKEVFKLISAGHIHSKLVISVMAGIPIRVFEERFGAETQVLRAMPNTPSLLGHGMSVLCFNGNVSSVHRKFAAALFSSVGETAELPESLIDVATALSGSGPAFFCRIAQAMAKAAAEKGFPEEVALKLLAQTLIGTGHLLRDSGKTPERIIAGVTSPGGTTEAGLKVFDAENLDSVLANVIDEAANRSLELSRVS